MTFTFIVEEMLQDWIKFLLKLPDMWKALITRYPLRVEQNIELVQLEA